jgi:hypothetical protein
MFFCSFTPGLGGYLRHRVVVAEPGRVPEGRHLQPLLRGAGLRLRLGSVDRPLPAAARRAALFPPPRHHEAAAPSPEFRSSAPTAAPSSTCCSTRALLVSLVRALVAPTPGFDEFLPIALIVPILGVLDKTTFLAARAEHYWVTIVCFTFATNWLPGAMAVQLALWVFAGVSKLNHHFPTVVAVMTSNGPFTRFEWMRKLMYKSYPN